MDKLIYLVRHGQTEWNQEERLQGWSDSPLSQQGIEQAKTLGEKLASIPLDSIYSSDLGRAYHTAKLLRGDRPIPIYQRKELRELALGPWEGLLFAQIQRDEPQALDTYFNQPQSHKFTGVEDYHDLMLRVKQFMKELREIDDKHILVVAHGVSIAAIVNIIEDRKLEDFWERPLVDGLSISLIEYKDRQFRLIQKGEEIKGSSY